MANGDDALAAGMDILDGTEDRRDGYDEINKTRDYVAQRTNAVTPIDKGGTGAQTAEGARAALGLVKTLTSNDAEGKVPAYNAAGQLPAADPTSSGQAANKAYVDRTYGVLNAADEALDIAKLNKSGGTVTGNVYFPNASSATSSYTVAYLNGDGRLSRGASSERYKKYITMIDPASLGDIWPELSRFQMRGGDGEWKYGFIAEHLAAHPDQQPFVVYADIDGDRLPDSIDFIALLMAQNAQLHQALDLLAQRVDALEAENAIP